jgi:hypothetical protein
MVALTLLEKEVWRVQWKETASKVPDPYDPTASPLSPDQPVV